MRSTIWTDGTVTTTSRTGQPLAALSGLWAEVIPRLLHRYDVTWLIGIPCGPVLLGDRILAAGCASRPDVVGRTELRRHIDRLTRQRPDRYEPPTSA